MFDIHVLLVVAADIEPTLTISIGQTNKNPIRTSLDIGIAYAHSIVVA